MRISTVWENTDVQIVNFPEENQGLDYARMCPNMTVPALEIDDRMICDSLEIQKYLATHYPGPGDIYAKGKQEPFIVMMREWDEGLFTYRRMGKMGRYANELRLLRLHQALLGAMEDGEENDKLLDGSTVLDKYIWKIASIHHLTETTSGEITPELQRRIDGNDELLKKILATATDLLERSSGTLLFSDALCSADGFLAAILFRCEGTDNGMFAGLMTEFPRVAEFWDEFKERDESDVITPYTMFWAKKNAARSGQVFKVLGLATGMLRVPALPEEIQERVDAKLTEISENYVKQ